MTMDVANLLERNAPGFELDAVDDAFPDYEVAGELDEDDVWAALEDVEDAELPVSLVDLGLIRDVTVEDGAVEVQMTLTYTGCPAKEIMVTMAERRLELLDGAETVDVELDYTEQWSPEDMTETGRERLGEAGFACSLSGRCE
jgi:metal-sulfur cluster biosynthetic enzyme